MKYKVIISQSAQKDFEKLDERWRSSMKNTMRKYLENSPKKESKSKIKRLIGLRQPQYRLRVDKIRVSYDVNDDDNRVEVLGFISKPRTFEWLNKHGVKK